MLLVWMVKKRKRGEKKGKKWQKKYFYHAFVPPKFLETTKCQVTHRLDRLDDKRRYQLGWRSIILNPVGKNVSRC